MAGPRATGALPEPDLSDLAALLDQPDLTAAEATHLTDRALALSAEGGAPTRTVRAAVTAVLRLPQLTARQETDAVELATRLVTAEPSGGTLGPLLALLDRPLSEAAHARVTGLGFGWLAACERLVDAPRALFALVGRPPLADDQRRALNAHALNWYAVNSEHPWAPEVRAFLTNHGDDGFGAWLRGVEETRAWLLDHPDDPERYCCACSHSPTRPTPPPRRALGQGARPTRRGAPATGRATGPWTGASCCPPYTPRWPPC